MNALPLIYGFRELVAGAGFVAGVTVEGCALVRKEEDGRWWMYGLQPGGIAEHGDTQEEAYLRFKEAFREVLSDSASLCATFEAFEADLEALGNQVNEGWTDEWQAARQALRNGASAGEGEFGSLPRKTGKVQASIRVVELRLPRTSAQDNPTETTRAVAA